MLLMSPRVLRELTPSCPPMWGRLATLIVLSGLTVVLLRSGLDVDQTLRTVGAVCALSIVTGVVGGGMILAAARSAGMVFAAAVRTPNTGMVTA